MVALLFCMLTGPTVEQRALVLSYLLKAQYALVRDQYVAAKEHADRALALDPQSADAAYLRLEILTAGMRRAPIQLADQRKRFFADLEKRLAQFPQDYRFQHMMGQLLVENRWAREGHSQTPDFYLREALRLMESGTRANNEEKADAYFDLGRWFYNADQPYKATLAFGKIEGLDPDNVRALEGLAKSAQNAHMLRSSLAAYKKYSKRSSFSFENKATPVSNAIHMLAYLIEPKPENLQALLDFLEKSGQDLSVLMRVADRMAFMGLEQELPTLLEQIPEPHQGRRYFQLYFLGLMSQAQFKKVVEVAQERAPYYTDQVLASIMEHGMEAAFLNGDYVTCLELAETYPQVSRFSARFELYAAFAAILHRQDDQLWQAMEKRRGPQDGMVRFVVNALEFLSFEEFAIRNKMQLLRQFGAYDAVHRLLDERYPDGIPPSLFEEVAINHILAGSPEKAFPIYEKLVASNPERADYHNNYGYFLADAGVELEKAKALIGRALELQPETPAYLDSYGWVHYRLGDLEQAERYVREALRFEPENAEKLEHLGDIYRRLGKEDVAREYWSQAMNQGGERYFEMMNKLDP